MRINPRMGTLGAGRWWVAILALLVAAGCSRAGGPASPSHYPPSSEQVEPEEPLPAVDEGWEETGVASWYGDAYHGRATASGESFDMYALTAAHRRLPFGTWVRVENLDNGRETVLRINDRGPFVEGRVLDVSRQGAEELGIVGSGTAEVRVVVVETP